MRINLSSLFKTVRCDFSCGESETSLFPVMYKTQLSSQSVQLINILLNGFLAAEEWMQKKTKKSEYMKKNMIMCHEMFVFFYCKSRTIVWSGFFCVGRFPWFYDYCIVVFCIDLLDWVVNKISIVSVFFKNQRDHFLFHFFLGWRLRVAAVS